MGASPVVATVVLTFGDEAVHRPACLEPGAIAGDRRHHVGRVVRERFEHPVGGERQIAYPP